MESRVVFSYEEQLQDHRSKKILSNEKSMLLKVYGSKWFH